ncbi:hypothetical protein WG66_016208, partial [Moniliophthora roreri]
MLLLARNCGTRRIEANAESPWRELVGVVLWALTSLGNKAQAVNGHFGDPGIRLSAHFRTVMAGVDPLRCTGHGISVVYTGHVLNTPQAAFSTLKGLLRQEV